MTAHPLTGRPLSKLTALIEIVFYLLLTSSLSLLYLFQKLDIQTAGLLAFSMLAGLVMLSWVRFDGGRHPCFLFLTILFLIMGGQFLAFELGAPIDPYQVVGQTFPFHVSTDAEAILLLSILLSAICVYAPSRFHYEFVENQNSSSPAHLLEYLRATFWFTLPFSLLENVIYFRYVGSHGGYLVLFTDRANMIASVPGPIRLIAAFMTPLFLAIFVLERRRSKLYLIAALYFLSSSLWMLVGSRNGILTTVLGLWYVSRIKSSKRYHPVRLLLLAGGLVALAIIAGEIRDSNAENNKDNTPKIASFLAAQGTTMGITELAIEFREHFAPYWGSYFLTSIESGLVSADQSNYVRGKKIGDDITVFLSPEAYDGGLGFGSSYLAESYVAGGVLGVIFFSLLIGYGLHGLYLSSATTLGLYASAVLLPSALWMARAGLFDWFSIVIRYSAFILILYLGWKLYCWIREGIAVQAKATLKI